MAMRYRRLVGDSAYDLNRRTPVPAPRFLASGKDARPDSDPTTIRGKFEVVMVARGRMDRWLRQLALRASVELPTRGFSVA